MRYFLVRILVVFGLVSFFGARSFAQDFFLNGNAIALNDSCYRLTMATNWEVGSIWNPDKVDLRASFDLVMEVMLGCSDSPGADGMVFGLQPVSTTIGVSGGDIGFGGVSPALGIEIDTYQNFNFGDPAYDHIAIIRDGIVNHALPNGSLAGPVQASALNWNVEDCDYHDFRVNWDADAMILEVYFDCELRLSYEGDIVNDIFGGDPLVFWGFTSGTGGENNRHEVCLTYTTFLDQQEDKVMCPGGQILLDAGGGVSYEWSPVEGLSDPTLPNPIARPSRTTLYTVQVFDACNQPFYDDVLISVAGDSVFFDLGMDTTLCTGDKMTLDAGTPTATYAWSTGASTPTFTVSEPGDYRVTVTRTDTVCTAEDQITIDYRPAARVDLPPDTSLCYEQTLLLEVGFPETTYFWQDGSRADTFLVEEAGTYQVVLEHFCGPVSDQIKVDYEDCRQLYLPNVFSPNDDGRNDRFYPLDGGDVSTIFSFQIFDRWGNLVFERKDMSTNTYAQGWNGQWRGKPAPQGVYVWTIEVLFRDGTRERRGGSVTLLR